MKTLITTLEALFLLALMTSAALLTPAMIDYLEAEELRAEAERIYWDDRGIICVSAEAYRVNK